MEIHRNAVPYEHNTTTDMERDTIHRLAQQAQTDNQGGETPSLYERWVLDLRVDWTSWGAGGTIDFSMPGLMLQLGPFWIYAGKDNEHIR